MEQSEYEWRQEKGERLRRAVDLVGEDAYRNNPLVHASLCQILYGVSVMEALGTAVKALAMHNERVTKDALAIACSRPLQMTIAKLGGDGS